MLFFGIFSYDKFNEVRDTMSAFQKELSIKRTNIANEQQKISATKENYSLQKQQMSHDKAVISEKKIRISTKKEEMIERSFQTGQKSGIIYLVLESIAKGERTLWHHAYLRAYHKEKTNLIPEMKALKQERNNLLRAFIYLAPQTNKEALAKEHFLDYIKNEIKPLLKKAAISIHKNKMDEYAKLKTDITTKYQRLNKLGHILVKNINAQTEKFDEIREKLRNTEADYIAKEKEMIKKEDQLNAKEKELKQHEKELSIKSHNLEVEGERHLNNLSHDIDQSLQTIFILLLLTIITLMVGGFLMVKSISKPIDILKNSADQLAKGHLDQYIDTSREDELGALAISFDQMRHAIRKKLSDLAVLNDAGETLASIHNQREALKIALKVMRDKTKVEQGSMYLIDSNNTLHLHAFYPLHFDMKQDSCGGQKSFQLGEGVAGHVADMEETLFIPDTSKDKDYLHIVDGECARALLCIPLMDDKKIFGVMNFSGEVDKVQFNPEEDKGFAETIARMTVITTKNIQMLKVIEEQNRTLEQKVLERTAELRQKTNDINSMLQNMQQGIFTIIEGNIIHSEYSAYLEEIYEQTDLAHMDALPFLFDNSSVGSNDLDQIKATLGSLIGEDSMMFEFNSHLLVTEYEKTFANNITKIIELDWNAVIDEEDIINKVMVTARDVTELRALQKEAEKQKADLEIIGQILSISQQKFQDFLKSSKEYIDENYTLITDHHDKDLSVIATLFRNMHTIKGNARTYGMHHITDVVHEAETTYDNMRKDESIAWDQALLLQELEDVKHSIDHYKYIYDTQLSGFANRKGAFIEQSLFEQMQTTLEQAHQENNPEALQNYLQVLSKTFNAVGTTSIHEILQDILSSLPALAKDLGKAEPHVIIHDNHIRINEDISPVLQDCFMHMFRNSMGHGIETAEERSAVGKPEQGTIQLDMDITEDNMLKIVYQDDGKGLNLKFIHKKAVSNGIFEEGQDVSDFEIAMLIFQSGLSTAEAVTTVSGRGVGMDAIRGFIRKQKGDISLEFLAPRTENGCRPFIQIITLPMEDNCVVL